MYYQVGQEIFISKFQAAENSLKTNIPIKFNCYDEAFDKADWSKDPQLSWDNLLDLRAKILADKNKPIILYFSGGTDSYTIFKVLERNNVPIHALYIRIRKVLESTFVPVLKFVKNIKDKNIKIIIEGDNIDFEDLADRYDSEDWIWKSIIKHQFNMRTCEFFNDRRISSFIGTDNFISLQGIEKPRLKFTETGVYSYQTDEHVPRVAGTHNSECFYITPELPELHIKQSYLLLKYAKSLMPNATSTKDMMHLNNLHNPKKHDWSKYSIDGCGRFGDLNYSFMMHILMAEQKLILPFDGDISKAEYQGISSSVWKSMKGSKIFKNYMNGVMSVVNDPVGKFLMRDTNNFYSLKEIPSKFYRLTF